MNFKTLHQFYASSEWEACKAQVLNERIKKDGSVVCEHCGKPILKNFNPNERNNKGAMVFHHRIYLNLLNVNDASVSLNPKNIQILHWSCHNEVHDRFQGGKPEKKVYLITGAPCSGKTSFVNERKREGDIVLDIDDIWQMVSGQPRYVKPTSLKPIVFSVRDEIKGLISRGAGTWRNAYIIESLPSPQDRQREAERYRAFNVEIITMDATKEECLERLRANPNGRNPLDYQKYIEEYFLRYRDHSI